VIHVCVFLIFSVRVSNELGLGRPRTAKYSVYVTVFQALLLGFFFMAIILATKDYYALIFTNSLVLQEAVSKLGFFLAITMVLNSVQPVISGIIDYHFPCLLHEGKQVVPLSYLQFWNHSYRCCCWRWVAGPGGLHQRRLLLLIWASTGVPSWL